MPLKKERTMHYTRLLVIVIATILALALGVFALVRHNTPQTGDPIIIKGGSLTIQCPASDTASGPQCFAFDTATGAYGHKNKTKKIDQIVVKDSTGAVLFDSSDPKHCGSALGQKPEIDILYK
jgi:hypothetical protein